MAGSSGTYNYSLSTGEGVLAAFERCQVRAPSIRQEHMLTARRETNLLFADWSNKQVNLWTVELDTINLVQGTATYSLPAKVVMILDAYRAVNSGTQSQTNIYMTPISRTEFASYATPQTQGPPTVFWYDRLINPTVTFYPTPDASYVWNYYACVQLQDANLSGGETPNLPYLWLDAYVAGLAHRLARTYAPQLEQLRKADAKEAWDTAATQDTENVNLSIQPAISGYYRR